MDQLFKLKESIVGYLSPAKRRRTVLPTTPGDKIYSMQRPVNPITEPKDSRHKAAISGRVNKKYLSPSDTKRSRVRKSKVNDTERLDEEEEEDVEEEGEEAEMTNSDIGPEDSSSQLDGPNYEVDDSAPNEDDEGEEEESMKPFEEESELDAETKVHRFLDQQAELTRIRASLEDIKGKGWHKDEIALFGKLSMRGLEPLLPLDWFHDFPTFPSDLFSKKIEETFINSRSGEDFRASAALASLVTLGSRVRDLLRQRKPQERLIAKEINNHIKWSERDGGYAKKRFLPRLCVVAGRPGQELPLVSKAIKDQMYFLAERHRVALALPEPVANTTGVQEMYSRPPPLLYGVIVAHCVIVMVALDPSELVPRVKTIAHFDLSDGEMDVWNGLAIAILVCTVRNKMIEDLEEMEASDCESSDPDL